MDALTPRSNDIYSSRKSLSQHSDRPGSSSSKKSQQKKPEEIPVQVQQPEQEVEENQETIEEVPQPVQITEDERSKILMEQYARRIKRDILENLNEIRVAKKLPKIYADYLSGLVADDYAEYLKSNSHDNELFRQVCDDYGNSTPINLIMACSNFEESGIPENFFEDFIDLGYTLLESEQDREQLLSPEVNSIGLGVSMTKDKILLVALASQKMLQITGMKDVERTEQGIEVKGIMLNETHGVYAVRLQKHETKKDLALVGPEFIEFDPKTKEFTAFLPVQEEGIEGASKNIELYVRKKPETIAYKVPSKEKIQLNHLEFAQRSPCVVYPLPKHVQEDKEDKETKQQEKAYKKRVEMEKKLKIQEESRERKQVKQVVKERMAAAAAAAGEDDGPSPADLMQGSSKRKKKYIEMKKAEQEQEREYRNALKRKMNQSGEQVEIEEEEEEGYEEDVQPEESGQDSGEPEEADQEQEDEGEEGQEDKEKEQFVDKNKQILMEIETALDAGQMELENQEDKNFYLQILVTQLKNKDLPMEKEVEYNMTEAKYANMLAHVHEIRANLKKSQDTYNVMARDLQQRLEKKQKDCTEIKTAFKALMQEVTKNAVYHHKVNKNSEKKFERWDHEEEEKSKELQGLRLETFRMEAQLTKNQKTLKKKDELADGLHLIDYEQLKIENQTLCEKIQERNENLQKMMKNHMNVVEILTHLKEKVHFLLQVNERMKYENETVDRDLATIRLKVNEAKKELQKYKMRNDDIRQETGIMSSPILRKDYEKTLGRIDKDTMMLDYLERKHEYISQVVNVYIKQNKWSKNIGSPTFQKKIFY